VDIIPAPVVDGAMVPIEEAIPGFYRCMLTARRGELVGVLPGRTATHVEALSAAYFDQGATRRRSCGLTSRKASPGTYRTRRRP